MQIGHTRTGIYLVFFGGFLLLLSITTHPVMAAPTLKDAVITEADVYAHFRYRFEHVDDDLAPNDANASTLRSVFGYQSGALYGFSTLLEAELVNRVFSGDYREFPGQPGSNSAVVADPDSTELNQGYLQYDAPHTRLRAGRQAITYRDAPFHRFIGTILWRQNWQTFDAVSLQNQTLAHTTLSYAWIWNVNRIFGDNSPSPLNDFDSDSHLLNLQYDRFRVAHLESYAYLLDFDNAPAASSATLGLRLQGELPLETSPVTPIYALEYAHQADHGDNPGDYDVSYQLVEGGFKFQPYLLDSLMLKASFERLSGTGTFAFQTPLGTNHAFQGTADRFLTTPRDGIRDTYGGAVATAWGFNLVAAWHVLEADKFDYRYGEEFDVELSRKLGRQLTLGMKYADYDADANATNLLRNGTSTVTADAQKFWFYAVTRF